jgi:8-oxo-dGTP pyrophosphatase MutT (NUDIX family)
MPTTLVVLAVVHHDGRYLIVEEVDGTFYLPAGRVEQGESLIDAAVRETAEEAGVVIEPAGLLGFDHDGSGTGDRSRLRFAFVAAPAGDTAPKRTPDAHSRGARWLRREEIAALPLRHPEVLAWIDRHRRGAPILPRDAYAWHARP